MSDNMDQPMTDEEELAMRAEFQNKLAAVMVGAGAREVALPTREGETDAGHDCIDINNAPTGKDCAACRGEVVAATMPDRLWVKTDYDDRGCETYYTSDTKDDDAYREYVAAKHAEADAAFTSEQVAGLMDALQQTLTMIEAWQEDTPMLKLYKADRAVIKRAVAALAAVREGK